MQLQVDRGEKEEGQGEGGLAPSSAGCSGASGLRMGPGPDSGSSAPSSVPQSLATSRDDEDDDDEESSRRSNGHRGSRLVILDAFVRDLVRSLSNYPIYSSVNILLQRR